jgi:hypothetical protein
LIAGLGVEGDAHAGETVKHRSPASPATRPSPLRQLHLIHAELRDEFNAAGFTVKPGDLVETSPPATPMLALPTARAY